MRKGSEGGTKFFFKGEGRDVAPRRGRETTINTESAGQSTK